jgi:hypothetical protein
MIRRSYSNRTPCAKRPEPVRLSLGSLRQSTRIETSATQPCSHKGEGMKGTVITGPWQRTTPQMRDDVRVAVHEEITAGNYVVTGGGLGVDADAVQAAMELYPAGEHTFVVIPTALDHYLSHYQARVAQGNMRQEDYDALSEQLNELKALGRVLMLPSQTLDSAAYGTRNATLVKLASRVRAFQVQGSEDTNDVVARARRKGIEVVLRTYPVDPSF